MLIRNVMVPKFCALLLFIMMYMSLSACTGLNLDGGNLTDITPIEGDTDEEDAESEIYSPEIDTSSDGLGIDFADAEEIPVSDDYTDDELAEIDQDEMAADDDALVADNSTGSGHATESEDERTTDPGFASPIANPETGAIEVGAGIAKYDETDAGNTDPQSGDPDNTTCRRQSNQDEPLLTRFMILEVDAGDESASATQTLMAVDLTGTASSTDMAGLESALKRRQPKGSTTDLKAAKGSSRVMIVAEIGTKSGLVAKSDEDGDADPDMDCEDEENSEGASAFNPRDLVVAIRTPGGSASLKPDAQGIVVSPVMTLAQGQSVMIDLQDRLSLKSTGAKVTLTKSGSEALRISSQLSSKQGTQLKSFAIQHGVSAQASATQTEAGVLVAQQISQSAPLSKNGSAVRFSFKSSSITLKRQ